MAAHLLEMRRHEMDHPLEPDRQLAQRLRRADRERLEEPAGKLHGVVLVSRGRGVPPPSPALITARRRGPDRPDEPEADAPQRVEAGEAAQEGGVQPLDGERPEPDVGLARAREPGEDRPDRVGLREVVPSRLVEERGDVGQPEVQSLRADRRQRVGGLAEEHEPPLRQAVDREEAERHGAARTVEAARPEEEPVAAVTARPNAASSSLARPAVAAAVSTQTRLDLPAGEGDQRAGPAPPVELGRGVAVRAVVRQDRP